MRSTLKSLQSLGLGSVNLALLSLYFVPVWGREALRALMSPYYGLEERAHAVPAIYVRQLFDLGFNGMAVTAHILAGVKLVIAAAFVAYAIEFSRACATGRRPDRETVDVVLIMAVVGVLLWVVPALAFGEAAMIRLYSTQLLLIAGAMTVIVIERHLAPEAETSRVTTAAREREDWLALPVGALTGAPPPVQAALAQIPETRPRSSR